MEDFTGLWFDCEKLKTTTATEQCSCEQECASFLKPFETYTEENLKKFREGKLINVNNEIRLLRSAHAMYLTTGLSSVLPRGFITLDASRPWVMYWITHALYLLESEPYFLYDRVIETLSHFQNSTGGFGGGPGQLSQGAPNYASVLALCTINSDKALSLIDRPAMYNYFMEMKQASGGFSIHKDGEVDSRGTYTIISIARLLNILTPELAAGVGDFIVSCQTYEGGFGGEPFNEAHGGYNFCALAALIILGEVDQCDLGAQENWLLRRQVKLEGGFQGRTNKLVDSCYSFWQGAALALVEMVKSHREFCSVNSDVVPCDLYDLFHFQQISNGTNSSDSENIEDAIDLTESVPVQEAKDTSGCLSFNQKALQRYILYCAQNVDGGGLRDKPGKSRDFYHSCYALSGLSIAQSAYVGRYSVNSNHSSSGDAGLAALLSSDDVGSESKEALAALLENPNRPQVFGDVGNLLANTSAVFNIGLPKLQRVVLYYQSLPSTHQELTELYNNRKP